MTLSDASVIALTRRWVERAVIGLNLCPFARRPLERNGVRFVVSRATALTTLQDDVHDALLDLAATPAEVCETKLLIVPDMLEDFAQYNDFLDDCDALIESTGLDGTLQIASFHPLYQFADSDVDAIENFTNRSPFPIFHVLRESSIERAVATIVEPDEIYRRNLGTLRKLGIVGWQALWVEST